MSDPTLAADRMWEKKGRGGHPCDCLDADGNLGAYVRGLGVLIGHGSDKVFVNLGHLDDPVQLRKIPLEPVPIRVQSSPTSDAAARQRRESQILVVDEVLRFGAVVDEK